ncbi:MAG TPA: hypothetical protein VFW83_06140, partial [Bryobacteraceae bacterium]|nr:hypothetical protein [Bryobacteraceae bacterium]
CCESSGMTVPEVTVGIGLMPAERAACWARAMHVETMESKSTLAISIIFLLIVVIDLTEKRV